METCKECIDFLSDYVDGYLQEETIEKLESHMTDCPPCLEFLRTFKTTVALARELKAEAVPDAVMLKVRSFLRRQMGVNHHDDNSAPQS